MPVPSPMTAGTVGGFVPGLTPAGLPFPGNPLGTPGESPRYPVGTLKCSRSKQW